MTKPRVCNVPGCDVTGGLVRGLCSDESGTTLTGHWWTHRDLADPDPRAEPAPEST